MANIKIYTAGTGTPIETVVDENRYQITVAKTTSTGVSTCSITTTTDTSYELMRYVPATNQQRTIVFHSSNPGFSQTFISDANSFSSGLEIVSYTQEARNGMYLTTITLPANKRLMICKQVGSSSSSGGVRYTKYGSVINFQAGDGGYISYWGFATKIPNIIPAYTWGSDETMNYINNARFNSSNAYTEYASGGYIGKWAVSPGDVVKIKSTSLLYPYTGSFPGGGIYMVAGSSTANGNGELLPINSSSIITISDGYEYYFEIPEGWTYVLSGCNGTTLSQASVRGTLKKGTLSGNQWSNTGVLHKRASGSWN